MDVRDHVYVVILAGGGGTRLWPKSREKTPKQFLRLYSEKSLMQDTYRRALLFAPPERILVISNRAYVDEVRSELPELPIQNIIGEPAKRETAAAMLLGAMIAYHRDNDAVIINLASDHIAINEAEFEHVLKAAVDVAALKENLVAVGITPTFPHSGLGYIKIGDQLSTARDLPVFKVDSFTEKPSVEVARDFIATGHYFWNACNYVWSARALMDAFRTYSPSILATLSPLLNVIDTDQFVQVATTAYESVEKVAIDYAISEKATNLVLIPGDFGWNDIGDWKVVYDLRDKNESGNVILCEDQRGEVVCQDSKNNLVHTHDRLIALVGMEDTIVVDTGEILLVMPRDRSQDVKKVVEKIKAENPRYL